MKVKTQHISIVLYKPKYAGNIGAAARAAKNMGLHHLMVVGAKDLDSEEIKQRATHLAADVVEKIRYVERVEEALSDVNYIIGTTARQGKFRGPFVTPREIASEVVQLSQKNKVALLFGPEDMGLANEQLRLCHAVVMIPTSREFTSLNLAQAVMILCYEIFVASLTDACENKVAPKWAMSSELEGMYAHIQHMLSEIGFLNPDNPEHWMLYIRKFFARSGLLSREVKIIRGICRQLEWYAKNKKT